jgi:S1-C subfamily serine protease
LARDEKSGQPESSTTPDFSAFDGASFSNIPANTDPAGGKKGVIITNVKRASGAYDFGLRKGDIVRRVNNKKISNLAEFKKKLAEVKGPVALTIQRGRSQVFIAVE